MVKGKIVVDTHLLCLINLAKKQLRISTPGYLESLKEICKFAINKDKKLRKTIQATLDYLQENCEEKTYRSENFFQELIQLDIELLR